MTLPPDRRPRPPSARLVHRTAVDDLAERHLDAQLELDPLAATFIGAPGFDDRMPDLSPAGLQARAELNRRTLRELSQASPVDDTDKVTIAAMTERLGVQNDLHELGHAPVGAEQHRQPGAEPARRLRPDADRHRRGMVADRQPAQCRAGGDRGLPRVAAAGRQPW